MQRYSTKELVDFLMSEYEHSGRDNMGLNDSRFHAAAQRLSELEKSCKEMTLSLKGAYERY